MFKNTIFTLLSLVSFFFIQSLGRSADAPPVTSSSSLQVTFVKSNGGVEFRAAGKPSTLKVVGKGSGFEGQFEIASGNAKGTAIFDLSSLRTGIEVRDNHMKEKYLETSKYPRADLKILDLKIPVQIDQKEFETSSSPFQGTLSLHGLEKPIKGNFSIKKQKDSSIVLEALFQLKLSDFGISIPSFAGITLDDQVEIKIFSTGQFLTKS